MKDLFFSLSFIFITISSFAQDPKLLKKNDPTQITFEIKELRKMILEIEGLAKKVDLSAIEINKLKNQVLGYRAQLNNLVKINQELDLEIKELKKNELANLAKIKELELLNKNLLAEKDKSEKTIRELENENATIKAENSQLRSQLLIAAQQSFENGVRIYGLNKTKKNHFFPEITGRYLTFDQMKYLCFSIKFSVASFALKEKIKKIDFEVYKTSSNPRQKFTIELKGRANSDGFIEYTSDDSSEFEFTKDMLLNNKGKLYIEHDKNEVCPFEYKFSFSLREK